MSGDDLEGAGGLLGGRVVDMGEASERLRPEAPLPNARTSVRRTIVLREALTSICDEAERALLLHPSVELYTRSGVLVRVVRDYAQFRGPRAAAAPRIEPIPRESLREQLEVAARFVKIQGDDEREVMPPEWVARTLLQRGRWEFPRLAGIVRTPSLRPDGTVLEAPGYDVSTGMLLEPIEDFPPIAEMLTRDRAWEAVCRLWDPISEFPFVENDGATAIAAMLTLVARTAIDGPVPMFAIRSPTPGSGKGNLADVIALIGCGVTPSRMAHDGDDGEMRKRVLAIALEGSPIVLLDNIDGELRSRALEIVLTATEWKDRILGVSKTASAPLRAVWFATGNGLDFRGDLNRRVLPIDLDPGVERPEDRAFRRPNLLEDARGMWPALHMEALTILRAYHLAGRPRHCNSRLGSYEAWDDLVRGACLWVGLADPVAGRARLRDGGDRDVDNLRVATTACLQQFGEQPFTAAQAVEAALLSPPFKEALTGLLRGDPHLTSRSLGFALRRVKGRIVDGVRFEQAGTAHGGTKLWRVGVGTRSLEAGG